MCYTSAIYHRNRHVPISIGNTWYQIVDVPVASYCCRRKLSWVIEHQLGWVIEMAPSSFHGIFSVHETGAMLGCLVGGKSYHQLTVYVLLMEEILQQLICSLSHYLQGFIHPRWCRISSINSMSGIVSYITNLTVIYTLNFHMLFFCFSRCDYWLVSANLPTCVKHHTILVVFLEISYVHFGRLEANDLPYPRRHQVRRLCLARFGAERVVFMAGPTGNPYRAT